MEANLNSELWEAATSGDLALVKLLCQNPSVNPNWQDPEKQRTPLYRACGHGRLEVVRFLLGIPGLEVNLQQREKGTPFYIACRQGHVDVIKLLLADERIDVNLVDQNGESPFSIACEENHVGVVSLLLGDRRIEINREMDEGISPFFLACQLGHVDIVWLLLGDERVDLNKPRDLGATPFYVACEQGHVAVVEILLAAPRIDVAQPMKEGATPFFIACQQGHAGVVEILLADPRVDVNLPRNNDISPLWIASSQGHVSVIQQLLASGREIEIDKRSTWNNRTAAEQARIMGLRTTQEDWETEEEFQNARNNGPKVADLIESFEKDPVAKRTQLRRQLGIDKSLAGELFALVVYLSDGYLTVVDSGGNEEEVKAKQFFSLLSQLPMDLQMVLCNRAFGVADSIVMKKFSERGFRKFVKGF